MVNDPYTAAYAWAEDVATHWYLDADGADRFRILDLDCGGALTVDVFDRLFGLSRSRSGDPESGRSPFQLAKAGGLDRTLRAWGVRLLSGRRGRPPRQARVALLSELDTPSAFEPLLAVARALGTPKPAVGAADPRAQLRWRRAGISANPLSIDLRTQERLLRRAHRAIDQAWAHFLISDPRFAEGGVDVTQPVLRSLRQLSFRSMPWLLVESAAIDRFLEDVRPEWLVVSSDQHRIGRLATTRAARHGVQVMVLQHGLPQARVGYVPIRADVVATWSPHASRWFVDQGADPARLVVLGNPRFDDLLRGDVTIDPGLPATARAASPRILLPLSGASAEVNAGITRIALNSLGQMPAGYLVIKLHPGLRDWAAVRDAVHRSAVGDRVFIAHRQPLYPLLRWADLTYLHRSSVAVESLVAGTPVAVAAVDGASVADHELAAFDLPVATTGQALTTLATRFVDRATTAQFLARTRDLLVDVAGPLDGQSARRIATYLSDPIPRSEVSPSVYAPNVNSLKRWPN